MTPRDESAGERSLERERDETAICPTHRSPSLPRRARAKTNVANTVELAVVPPHGRPVVHISQKLPPAQGHPQGASSKSLALLPPKPMSWLANYGTTSTMSGFTCRYAGGDRQSRRLIKLLCASPTRQASDIAMFLLLRTGARTRSHISPHILRWHPGV